MDTGDSKVLNLDEMGGMQSNRVSCPPVLHHRHDTADAYMYVPEGVDCGYFD